MLGNRYETSKVLRVRINLSRFRMDYIVLHLRYWLITEIISNLTISKRSSNGDIIIFQCAEKINLNITELKSCCQGKKGDELLAKYGDQTLNLDPSISFVPTITYNGIYDVDDQWRTLKDFVAVICDKLKGTKPQICLTKHLPTTEGYWLF